MSSEDDLRPCPFCGLHDLHIVKNFPLSYVTCDACEANGPYSDNGSYFDAIDKWNKRAKGTDHDQA